MRWCSGTTWSNGTSWRRRHERTTWATRTTWTTRCPSSSSTTSQSSPFHESCARPSPMCTTTTTTTTTTSTTTTTMCPTTTTTMWMLWKEINYLFKTLSGETLSVFDLVLTTYGTKEEYSDYITEIPRQMCMESCIQAIGYELKRKDHYYSKK